MRFTTDGEQEMRKARLIALGMVAGMLAPCPEKVEVVRGFGNDTIVVRATYAGGHQEVASVPLGRTLRWLKVFNIEEAGV